MGAVKGERKDRLRKEKSGRGIAVRRPLCAAGWVTLATRRAPTFRGFFFSPIVRDLFIILLLTIALAWELILSDRNGSMIDDLGI